MLTLVCFPSLDVFLYFISCYSLFVSSSSVFIPFTFIQLVSFFYTVSFTYFLPLLHIFSYFIFVYLLRGSY
jgi:hypothetical protein